MTAKPEELSGREQPRLAAPPPMGEGFSDDKARALHMLDEARWRKIEGRNRGADCYGDRRGITLEHRHSPGLSYREKASTAQR